ncbi:MAG: OprO/OprP family phosphate-selective porin, partial [Gammaproteobacteria bacterium]|nr:OprO/OprP family phosphate-selective porin [Gammaproteobacteria bacterium]
MKLNHTLLLSTLAGSLVSPLAFAETTIGGYGELHYNNLDKNGTDFTELDFHRFVLEVGHDFNDRIRFFSEVELEHALVKDTADGSSPGEYELEQAYIELDLSDSSSLKTGIFLIPVGILNETHEPPTFYGVERNPIEKNIIPATWWEGGALYSAHMENGISYDLAIHSGLANIDGNIRSGRQKVAESNADSLAYTARIKYTGIAGLELSATANVQ